MRKKYERPFVAKATKYVDEVEIDEMLDGNMVTRKLAHPMMLIAGHPYFLCATMKKVGVKVPEPIYTIRELTPSEHQRLAQLLKERGEFDGMTQQPEKTAVHNG